MHPRTGAELAATALIRAEQIKADDLAVLYPLAEQARTYIETHAGPDRTAEIAQLEPLAARLPELEDHHHALTTELARLHAQEAVDREVLAEVDPILEAKHNRHWWARPSRWQLTPAEGRSGKAWTHINQLRAEHRPLEVELRKLDNPLHAARQAADTIPTLQAAQAERDRWLARHHDAATWADQLAQNIKARTRRLGHDALHQPPAHLLEILGIPGEDLAPEEWARANAPYKLKPNLPRDPQVLRGAETTRGMSYATNALVVGDWRSGTR